MRDGAAAARVAHNHEVPGSSPGPATMKNVSTYVGIFFIIEAMILIWDRAEVEGEQCWEHCARKLSGCNLLHTMKFRGRRR